MVGDLTGRSAISFMARLITAHITSRFTNHKFLLLLARPNKEDLRIMRDLMSDEKLKPVLDKSYRLSEVPEALRYLGEKHARGKVVITLD